jgi:hypothetical protein
MKDCPGVTSVRKLSLHGTVSILLPRLCGWSLGSLLNAVILPVLNSNYSNLFQACHLHSTCIFATAYNLPTYGQTSGSCNIVFKSFKTLSFHPNYSVAEIVRKSLCNLEFLINVIMKKGSLH